MPSVANSPCRLIIDSAAAGAWQMSVDEVLLESAAAGRSSLRFYRWSEPTLSLGYFQPYALRASHRPSRDCALVRRQTGGGAILHDRELTYSLAVGVANPLAGDTRRLYDAAHEALVRALAEFGLQAVRVGQTQQPDPTEQPFLCFQRRARGDVLLGESKICGSAQRRRRRAILQHGSLLLARSPQAPELPGIADLTGKTLAEGDLILAWRKEFGRGLGLVFEPEGLSPCEKEATKALALEKFDAALWNRQR
jgi:lipoate-protein ligase A